MVELIVAVTLAILISAGCSLMEAVLYSVPMRHVEAASQAGKPGAGIFKSLKENIEKPIAAILSLNTVANTAGAAVAGAAATAVFGHERLGYFSILFTLAILLFSEIIPKTAGVVYGPSLISTVAYALKGLVHIMSPAIWLTTMVTRLVARGKTEEAITSEEIRIMARLSLRSGEINPYQEQIIENILVLHNKTVKEVMTPRTVIFSLSEHLTVKEAAQAPPKWEHSRFPVYDHDPEDIVGIVLTRELFVAITEGKDDIKLTELMRPVHFVVETAKLNNVFIEFLERKEHLFVVLDEYGGIAGLVTLEDVLEEILGREIVDEFDEVEDKRELARRQRKMLIGE